MEVILRGYDEKNKKFVYLQIDECGRLLGLETWRNLRPNSIKRFSGATDVEGSMIFEDDVIKSELNGQEMVVCYGEYEAYCPENNAYMESTGFYCEGKNNQVMAMGDPRCYARKIGTNDLLEGQRNEFIRIEEKPTKFRMYFAKELDTIISYCIEDVELKDVRYQVLGIGADNMLYHLQLKKKKDGEFKVTKVARKRE